MNFSTRAIHVGSEPDDATGAVMPPIYMTSTFELESPGHSKGFEYTRLNNPNYVRLEQLLASLEDAKFATVCSSGMGALTALASTLQQGDKVVTLNGIYGGTYRLFNHILNRFGIEFINIPVVTKEFVEKALKETKPKWLLFETPTNPLMNIFSIEEMANLAKKYNVLTVVDSTFASPYCQNPLKWGADVVWHSTTKYIAGHSDVLGGVIITNEESIKQSVDFARKTLGVNPSPFDCWLIMRGAKTLSLRMEQHQKNALAIANFFEKHPKVKKLYYPGHPSHPSYEIAKKQMTHFNGMLSVDFNLSLDETLKMISSYKLFSLAESLGGVESLVCHPATMTHAIVPKNIRDSIGLGDGLVRFSIGIEDSSDLIKDIEFGFSSLI